MCLVISKPLLPFPQGRILPWEKQSQESILLKVRNSILVMASCVIWATLINSPDFAFQLCNVLVMWEAEIFNKCLWVTWYHRRVFRTTGTYTRLVVHKEFKLAVNFKPSNLNYPMIVCWNPTEAGGKTCQLSVKTSDVSLCSLPEKIFSHKWHKGKNRMNGQVLLRALLCSLELLKNLISVKDVSRPVSEIQLSHWL